MMKRDASFTQLLREPLWNYWVPVIVTLKVKLVIPLTLDETLSVNSAWTDEPAASVKFSLFQLRVM
jgi:hypothetical protein